MDRKHAVIVLVLLAVGLAAMVGGEPTTGAGRFSELHREVVGGTNFEVVMGLIERSGESTSAKHYHPGGEFGFVLEGAVAVATASEPQATLEAGDSFYQPAGEWHVIRTAPEGARAVVFRILEKGQPMIVAVD